MWTKRLVKAALGSRLPITSGSLKSDKHRLQGKLEILRDEFGVPHLFADHETDAWFGLGFCQGQDRTFQNELMNRIAQGRLAEWFGPRALIVDRLSRRIGFHRVAKASFALLPEADKRIFEAFAAGVNLGRQRGLPKRPHEYLLLRRDPGVAEPEDAIALLLVMTFLLPNNWDIELTRLKILSEDGADALQAVDPSQTFREKDRPEWGGIAAAVARDLEVFLRWGGRFSGSNNWVVSGEKTKTGRPILCDDPHLYPAIPSQWYLCHVKTPHWEVAGASLSGTPGVVIGNNQFGAWGVTAGLVDNTDFFIEERDPQDPTRVRGPKGWETAQVIEERIAVKGKPEVVEKVLITERGPIIDDALGFKTGKFTLSLAATWLTPRPVKGILTNHKSTDFESFRQAFDGWAGLSLNYLYAHRDGKIGWQLVGQPPQRGEGTGAVPKPAWEAKTLWKKDLVPFAQMPCRENPADGFLVTANNKPEWPAEKLYLSGDWLEPLRRNRIAELLKDRDDWDVEGMLQLQLDRYSLTWRQLRAPFLQAMQGRAELAGWRERWEKWDGVLAGDSAEATLFILTQVEMTRRLIRVKTPRAYDWAMGMGFHPSLAPHNWFNYRRASWLAGLVESRPAGWGVENWDHFIGECISAVLGRFPGGLPVWGKERPVYLVHPLGVVPGMSRLFNRGPIALGGDENTVLQAGVDLRDHRANAGSIPGVRTVIDVGEWQNGRYCLSGGQSGNPLSPHYDDQFLLWQRGEGIGLWRTREDLSRARAKTLQIT